MKRYSIAAIPGDGIGTEVIEAGLDVLDAVAEREGFALDVTPHAAHVRSFRDASPNCRPMTSTPST